MTNLRDLSLIMGGGGGGYKMGKSRVIFGDGKWALDMGTKPRSTARAGLCAIHAPAHYLNRSFFS